MRSSKNKDARLARDIETLREEVARLQAERDALIAAQDRQKLLAGILENMTDWVTVADPSGMIVYTTPSVRAILGYEPEELIGKETIRLFWQDADGGPSVQEVMQVTLEQGSWRGEVHKRGKDNQRIIVSLQTSALRDQDGNITGIISAARDITEQKQTEQALLLSEQRFRETADLLPGALCELDTNMGVMYVNKSAVETFGYSFEELRAMRSVVDLFHLDDRKRATDGIRRLLSGERLTSEYRMVCKDGTVLHMLLSSSPIYRDGKIVGFRSSLTDISESRRAEKERQATEERYRMLVEAMNDGLGVQDADGVLTYVNNRLCTMFGYTPEEAIGRRTVDFLDDENRKVFFREVAKRKERDRTPYELMFLRKDATPVPVMMSPAPLYDADGRFQGSFAVLTDMTIHKKAEEAVRASEERFRTILENSRDIAFKFDAVANRYEYVSPSVEELLGFSQDEIMGMTSEEVDRRVHSEDAERVAEHRRKQERPAPGEDAPPLIEYRLRHKNGDYRWFCESTKLIHEEDGRLVSAVGTLRDITEQKQGEQALLTASRMEATATLAGGIAHDFNNLMVGVLGNAELIQLKLGPQPEVDRLLSNIVEAAQRAGELAQKMLAFARGGKYQPQILNLNENILETLQLEERSFPPRISIERDLAQDLWPIQADPTQMNQVIMNLSINAVEAIEDHGRITIVTRNLDVDPRFARIHPGLSVGPHVYLSVEDTGKGMSPDVKAKVFEPFFTTKFQGRGLGLAAVYGIVKNHNGFISAYSEEGKGTSFKAYLPAIRKEAAVTPAEGRAQQGQTERPAPLHARGRETILLVDDEEVVATVTREILEGLGYNVLVARNGREAVDMAKNYRERIDLSILDLGMPVMSGAQAYFLLTEVHPEMKVIICSGYELGPAAQALLDAGAAAFVQKPYRTDDLAAEIRKALQ